METLHPNQETIIEIPGKPSNPKITDEFKPPIINISSSMKSDFKSEIDIIEEVKENSIEKKECSQPIFTYQKPTLYYLTPEEKVVFNHLSTKIQKALEELSTLHCHLN